VNDGRGIEHLPPCAHEIRDVGSRDRRTIIFSPGKTVSFGPGVSSLSDEVWALYLSENGTELTGDFCQFQPSPRLMLTREVGKRCEAVSNKLP
jgi:hypothetical protein